MATFQPEKICAKRKKAIEELIKGRDTASQLQILFGNPTGDHGHVPGEELLVKISKSFSDSLSVLTSSCNLCEVCQFPESTQVGYPSCGGRRSVASGESSKRAPAKAGRFSSTKRKTSSSWKKVSPTSADEHAWRKYGQKVITNAKFPRCYFRCTHKTDQGCIARRQVQRIQENPTIVYEITYFGHHTCRSYPLNYLSQNPLLHSDPVDSSLLSFQTNTITTEKEHQQYPSCPSSAPLVKNKCIGEQAAVQSDNLSGDLPGTDSISWPELMPLEPSRVYTSTSYHDGFDMGNFLMDFERDFPFDEPDNLLAGQLAS